MKSFLTLHVVGKLLLGDVVCRKRNLQIGYLVRDNFNIFRDVTEVLVGCYHVSFGRETNNAKNGTSDWSNNRCNQFGTH